MATWYFPPSNGGRDQGIHDAGIETFKGNLERYLARESIQNSIDARPENSQLPVKVVFELLKLPRQQVAGLSELTATFVRCREYWADDPDATAFFDNAHRLGSAKHINILRIGDSNTTGVPGADDDRTKGWYKLVKCSGASGKAPGSGGSFGIGKSAPFAASGMQTVLYSTMTEDRAVAFLGLAVLVTHEKDGEKFQNVGWFGGRNGQSERNLNRIPSTFRRSEPGTDLLVLGYKSARGWQEELVSSILENFWPAISRGELEVTVDGERITADVMPSLMERYSERRGFRAHHYYKAYTQSTSQHPGSLQTIGDVSVRLLVGESLPCKIAMVRKTGMVVYHQQVKGTPVPYCGVFECINSTGNDILRRMEPPAHDKWDRDRPPPDGSRRVAEELTSYLRDCVKTLTPPPAAQELPVEDLNQYFPDEGDIPDESFGQPPVAGTGTQESVVRIPIVVTPPRPPAPPPGPEVTARLTCHAFCVDPDAGVYTLFVDNTSEVRGPLTIAVAAVGDDSEAEPVRLASARLSGGGALPIPRLGHIGPVPVPQRGALRLEATLAEPDRLALRVTAWEGGSDATE